MFRSLQVAFAVAEFARIRTPQTEFLRIQLRGSFASGPDRDCSGRSAANVTTIRPPRRSRWHVEPTTDPERDDCAATTRNLLFRKVMVDAVVAISLAKPSKP